ncbi:MAG: ubiquinol-cytochrome c reductase iron-sulfur subunit [Bacteroidales bacterium]|nr:ubiquinol-cytochrome c reductase iron-sulfur subunit [Bacteroidales bacterium]
MNRRNFFELGVFGVLLSFVFFWRKLTFLNTTLLYSRSQKLLYNKNKIVAFFDDFIIVNKDGEPKVFNAHCTHLGCSINKMENGVLVCPCHGSHFNLEGEPIKGPAYKSLEQVDTELSADEKYIQITT